MKRHQGFTLVELMISTTVLIMVMMVGTYGYSLFTRNWERHTGLVDSQFENAKDLARINKVLDSVVPLVIYGESEFGAFFFKGKVSEVTAISATGMFTSGGPVVFSLAFEEQEGEGSLLYKELPITSQLITSAEQNINYQYQTRLLKGVDKAEFSYLGWANFDAKIDFKFNPQGAPKMRNWQPSYLSHQTRLHPEKLRVRFTIADESVELFSTYLQDSEKLLRGVGTE